MEELQDFIKYLKSKNLSQSKIDVNIWTAIIEWFARKFDDDCKKQKEASFILGIEYKVLSELEDKFPKNSKHSVAKHIDNRMREILKLINNNKSK